MLFSLNLPFLPSVKPKIASIAVKPIPFKITVDCGFTTLNFFSIGYTKGMLFGTFKSSSLLVMLGVWPVVITIEFNKGNLLLVEVFSLKSSPFCLMSSIEVICL